MHKQQGKVLVTGAAGFIGSWLCKSLLQNGHQVIGLDDLSGGYKASVGFWQSTAPEGKAIFVEGTVLDRHLLRDLFSKYGFDYVFHLAAYAAEGMSPFIRYFNYENNVLGSMAIINECLRTPGVKCLVFASSIAVYGSGTPPFVETAVPCPIDPYGSAKLAVEYDIMAAHRTHGLPFLIFRPHNVFGEYQNLADPFRNVVGIFMNQIMRGESLTIFGDGSQQRAFTYVSDVATCMANSIAKTDKYNEVYNIGGDEVVTVLRLAELIATSMGTTARIRNLPARHEAHSAYSDHGKVRRDLGFIPSTSIEDGVAAMARWAKTIGPVAPRVNLQCEVMRGMPAVWEPILKKVQPA